jgi:glutathione synthase/RimK-type ligase-like ATP-grasp enzyme
MIQKAAIHLERYGKISDTIQRYRDILELNNIETFYVDVNDLNFWQVIEEVDLFIFRYSVYDDQKQIAQKIIPVIQNQYNKKVFPDMNTCWAYDDKIKQAMLLQKNGFPFAASWYFFDKQKALQWLQQADYPLVFKLTSGSRSQNVLYVKDYPAAAKIVKLMFRNGVKTDNIRLPGSTFYKDFTIKHYLHEAACKLKRLINDEDLSSYWSSQKNYCLFQKYLPNNNYDTRITIIGKRAFGVMREMRKDDFRASGSGKLIFDLKQIDIEMVKNAFNISKELGFQCMGYDFMYDDSKQPKIIEMSYTFPDIAIDNAEGYWDENMNFHKMRNCTQYYQLCDLLDREDLKLPGYLQFS